MTEEAWAIATGLQRKLSETRPLKDRLDQAIAVGCPKLEVVIGGQTIVLYEEIIEGVSELVNRKMEAWQRHFDDL